ncbi:DUF6193 family natural product biosynthesis protein [Streptomyces olivaceoviridis]
MADHARTGGPGPDFPEFGTLVEAAHAELRLRQLYVFSRTLGFSSCTGRRGRHRRGSRHVRDVCVVALWCVCGLQNGGSSLQSLREARGGRGWS